jgi:thiol-disulfide isomerase/thioredoxin
MANATVGRGAFGPIGGRTRARVAPALAALTFLIATIACLARAAQAAPAAPDPLALAELAGKVVYVDFFASWCGPCRQSFPWLADLQRRYGRDGLVVIAVNVDRERADAEAFLGEFPPSFRVHFDPEGRIAERYRVAGMPAAVLIDRHGRVREQHAGFRSRDAEVYERAVRSLLAEAP